MMWKLLVTILLSTSLVSVCCDHTKRRKPNGSRTPTKTDLIHNPTIEEKTIIDSIQELSLDLSAAQWEQRNAKNVVHSPISISSLLSIIMLGARGNSNLELKRALRLPNHFPAAVIHESFQKVLGSIDQKTSGVNVTMNTRLFLQEGLPIVGIFTQIAQALYNSQVRGVDFINAPSRAKDTINQWVEETTFGKIKDLISKPFLTTTRFIAVNTIYFSGGWENPFSKALTFNGIFNTGSKNLSIPMMVNIITVPYLKGGDKLGFDMISLPYKGGKYAMIVMTPTGKAGIQSLRQVEYSLDSANVISQLMGRMKKTKVSVTIPRMKLKHKLYLKTDLESLEVRSIFDRKTADFGSMTTASGVYIEDIVHEAIIEITENGTVAAAATAVSLDRIGGSEYFQLNKPSLMFIKDLSNELTLFYARIVEPEPIF